MKAKSRARATAVLLALGLAAPAPARTQTAPDVKIDATTSLFCKDDSGDIKPVNYASLGTLMRKYAERYNFKLIVERPPLVLDFANPDESPFFIRYTAEPYRDESGRTGVLLLSLHVSMQSVDRQTKGTSLCYFAAFGS